MNIKVFNIEHLGVDALILVTGSNFTGKSTLVDHILHTKYDYYDINVKIGIFASHNLYKSDYKHMKFYKFNSSPANIIRIFACMECVIIDDPDTLITTTSLCAKYEIDPINAIFVSETIDDNLMDLPRFTHIFITDNSNTEQLWQYITKTNPYIISLFGDYIQFRNIITIYTHVSKCIIIDNYNNIVSWANIYHS